MQRTNQIESVLLLLVKYFCKISLLFIKFKLYPGASPLYAFSLTYLLSDMYYSLTMPVVWLTHELYSYNNGRQGLSSRCVAHGYNMTRGTWKWIEDSRDVLPFRLHGNFSLSCCWFNSRGHAFAMSRVHMKNVLRFAGVLSFFFRYNCSAIRAMQIQVAM